MSEGIKFFDTFSGYGGFHLGITRAIPTAECIGNSEIDKYASAVYKHIFGGTNYGDITTIDPRQLPEINLFVGGFPCQAFSIAGKRRGFDEARGTLFFDIIRILNEKKPRLVLLENVKGLLSHDGGRTFKVIISTLAELGYSIEWQVLNSKNFGVPQNRERVFIVGHLGGFGGRQVFPIRESLEVCARRIPNEEEVHDTASTLTARQFASWNGNYIKEKAVVGTLRTHKDGRGFRECKSGLAPTIPARAREDGSGQPVITVPVLTPDRLEKRQNGRRFKTNGEPMFTLNTQDKHGIYDGYRIRRLTPIECERLMGLPDNWTAMGNFNGEVKEISDTQRYKLCGNGVVVNVVEEIIRRLYE